MPRSTSHLLRLLARYSTGTACRSVDLRRVIEARRAAKPSPSLRALLVKTGAHASLLCPALLRSPTPWPFVRHHRHAEPICSTLVEGQPVLVRRPHALSLVEIEARLAGRAFAGRIPTLFDRLRETVSPAVRAERVGTFAATIADDVDPALGVLPCLWLGREEPTTASMLKLHYDRRVMSGRDAEDALDAVATVLHERILFELRYLERLEAA